MSTTSPRITDAETILQSITMQSAVTAVLTMSLGALIGQAAPPSDIHASTAIWWLLVLASVGGYGLYVFVTRTLGATTVSTLLRNPANHHAMGAVASRAVRTHGGVPSRTASVGVPATLCGSPPWIGV